MSDVRVDAGDDITNPVERLQDHMLLRICKPMDMLSKGEIISSRTQELVMRKLAN